MMMLVYRMARRVLRVELAGDEDQHGADHRHRKREDQLLAEWNAAERERQDDGAEGDAAAENAPVDRPALARLRADQQHADHRDRRNDQAEEKDRLAAEEAREPSGCSGDRQDAERQRQAAEHLHHAELGADLVLRAGIAGAVDAGDHLGRHGVGHHVLDHGADDDQHRAENVEMVGAREREPSAGGAGERQQAAGRQGGADQDIGPPLRAEDRNAVDQLAEHHLDGPGQAQPDADPGELGRVQGQLLLDPHVAADVDDPQCAIGEIDHHQRQVGEAEAQDRPQQGGQPGRCGGRRPERFRRAGGIERLIHAGHSVFRRSGLPVSPQKTRQT